MAKPYDDDLRQKFLEACDRGEGSISELALRFGVSVGWGWKISAARNRTGQAERVPHKPGRKQRAGVDVQQQVRDWFVQQPDLTLVEVQRKLYNEAAISLGLPRVWNLLRKLGLRLKKSHSTPAREIAKPTASSAKSLLRASGRSRRNT